MDVKTEFRSLNSNARNVAMFSHHIGMMDIQGIAQSVLLLDAAMKSLSCLNFLRHVSMQMTLSTVVEMSYIHMRLIFLSKAKMSRLSLMGYIGIVLQIS